MRENPSVRLGVFPTIFAKDQWSMLGNGLTREVGAAWQSAGYSVRGLESGDLLEADPEKLSLDLIHLNWTEGAAQHLAQSSSRIVRGLLRLPRLAEFAAVKRMASRLARFRAAGISIVYQAHDLYSNWLLPRSVLYRLDLGVKSALLQHSDAWVVQEDSSLAELRSRTGPPAHIVRCPLGDFAKFHGPAVSSSEARTRLGLPPKAKIFLATGYFHERRDPRLLVQAFLRCATSEWRLVVASMNLHQFLGPVSPDPRITFSDGFIPNETCRDLFCAADWIVMDGTRYLTSAVVRTALSYERPIVCRRFGNQIDMAEGAAVWIDESKGQPLDHALRTAAATSHEHYSSLCAGAARQNQMRTWNQSHLAYRELVEKLVDSRNSARPHNTELRLRTSW